MRDERRKHTLLVVDDEPDVVQSLQDLLRLDYRVLGATRAAEALTLLEGEVVDVVMSDQRMPGMSGVEFLRRVREAQPDATRLLFTGYADIKAVIDAINQGSVYRYITKPWDPDELQTIIRQAAEQHDLVVERKRLLVELQTKNQELERANADLKEANTLKEAFIRVANHELRTPLTIVQGLTELALRAPGQTAPVRDLLPRIHQAGLRLNRLVEQLTKMLQAGQFERPLERRPISLAALVGEAAEDVRPFVELRKQHLTVDMAPDLGTIQGDAGKLRDSLDHLLLNAIKFTPDNGSIQIHGRRLADNAVEISVKDTGVGIDAANLPHIFQPFFTAFDVSRHASGQFEFGRRGLGLGLTLVKAFVEMHGGHVDVVSTPGQGSTFTVSLPAVIPELVAP